MNRKTFLFLSMAALATACADQQSSEPYTIPQFTTNQGLLTPESLWQLGRIGDVVLSPDGSTAAFTVSYTDIAEDCSYTDIYTVSVNGGTPRRITFTKENEYSIAWHPDGQRIAYLATKSNNPQVWTIRPDGTDARQITDVEGGIENYLFSPNGTMLAYTQRVKLDTLITDRHPDLPKANARLETDLMYRHWNNWADGKYSHIFIAKVDNMAREAVDIMQGERFHSPLMPFGGIEQIAWTPDGSAIAYTCKKLTGRASAESTNSDIYLYDIATRTTRDLTPDNNGYDTNPQFTPDGRKMLWLSMEHDGYESDKNRLMSLDLVTQQTIELTAETENHCSDFCLSPDGKTAYFIADELARDQIFSVSVDGGTIRKVTNEDCDYKSLLCTGDKLIAKRQSISQPTEIFAVDIATGTAENISNINTESLTQVKMGRVEERWITTTDNKKMLTWVIFPPDFDATKKYPALLYCQGGPQSTVSQFWSSRWNFQLMAANGYIVVAPNRRGLPGFGRQWNEQISGDYGGQNMRDYLSAIDAVSAEQYVDNERLGAVGASYGGFSIYWLAGNHEKRFKAFVAHCGIFNLEMMYPTTEEMFFVNWDLKGAPWDKDNKAAMKSYSASPHLFVRQWDTPIMVIHGERDFRIPYTQGMAAFNTAIMRGIDAEFLYFPDECHWVLKPQNSIVWHREFFSWLDKWLK